MKRRDLLKVVCGLSAIATLPLVSAVKGEAKLPPVDMYAKGQSAVFGRIYGVESTQIQCYAPKPPSVQFDFAPKDPDWFLPFDSGDVYVCAGDILNLNVNLSKVKRHWDVKTALTVVGCTHRGVPVVKDGQVCRLALGGIEVREAPDNIRMIRNVA